MPNIKQGNLYSASALTSDKILTSGGGKTVTESAPAIESGRITTVTDATGNQDALTLSQGDSLYEPIGGGAGGVEVFAFNASPGDFTAFPSVDTRTTFTFSSGTPATAYMSLANGTGVFTFLDSGPNDYLLKFKVNVSWTDGISAGVTASTYTIGALKDGALLNTQPDGSPELISYQAERVGFDYYYRELRLNGVTSGSTLTFEGFYSGIGTGAFGATSPNFSIGAPYPGTASYFYMQLFLLT